MMTEDSDDPARLAEELRMAAREVGALVLPAILDVPKSCPRVALEARALAALVRHVRPHVVYVFEQIFEADGLFEDEDVARNPAAKALLRRYRKQDGRVARMTAAVVVDGVTHLLLVDAPWFVELEEAAERIAEEHGADRAEVLGAEAWFARRQAERDAAERVAAQKAPVLAADPRFVAPKATKAKRAHLSAAIFPDLDHALHAHIVEKAEAILWLQGTASP